MDAESSRYSASSAHGTAAFSSNATVVAGVGYRWQGDLSFGPVVVDALSELDLAVGVRSLDLGYGAIYAAQDVADLNPPCDRLVLIAGTVRERPQGRLYEFMWDGALPSDEIVQALIREAGAGVIHIDHLLVVGTFLGALPRNVYVIEAEPTAARHGEHLSPALGALVPTVVNKIQHVVRSEWRQTATCDRPAGVPTVVEGAVNRRTKRF